MNNLENNNLFLMIGKISNLSLNIWEMNKFSLENKEINTLSWISSHFECQEMARDAFQSV